MAPPAGGSAGTKSHILAGVERRRTPDEREHVRYGRQRSAGAEPFDPRRPPSDREGRRTRTAPSWRRRGGRRARPRRSRPGRRSARTPRTPNPAQITWSASTNARSRAGCGVSRRYSAARRRAPSGNVSSRASGQRCHVRGRSVEPLSITMISVGAAAIPRQWRAGTVTGQPRRCAPE